MNSALAEALQPRVKRLGYLGEWFSCAAHAPEVLLAFMNFTDALKDAIPERAGETLVLTIATWLGNDYERHQHERLCVRLGFGRDWIADVEKLNPGEAGLLSESERAAQSYALAVLRTQGRNAQQEFAKLLDHFTYAESVAAVMLVGRYFTHSVGVHTLGLKPPVPSIFEDGFNG